MKQSTHNHVDSFEKQHYKKKFLTRKMQEDDAEQQIKQYTRERSTAQSPMSKAQDVASKREV